MRLSLCLLLTVASVRAIERRGSPPAFSLSEQALFGSCFSEDCVLGSSAHIFATGAEEKTKVTEVKNVKNVPAKGFQPPPSFASRRPRDN